MELTFKMKNDGDPGTLQFGWRHLGLLKMEWALSNLQAINV